MINGDQAERLNYWLEGRYKVLFQLAVESGLRISDLLNLRVKDIASRMTVYETKSRRKRTFTISHELLRDLSYLTDCKINSDYVFQSERDSKKHVHRSTIHRQIKKALKWLDFDASAHSARKLYAKTIFNESGSVECVQRALNHQKLSTTFAYLDIPQQNEPEEEKDATKKPKNIIGKIKDWFHRMFTKKP